MKTSFLLLLSLLLGLTVSLAQNSTITGLVKYDNTQQSLITDSAIVNLYQGGNIVQSANVNPDASYTFTDLPDGTYILKVVCNKKAGGLNATDGLIINKHFVGMVTLTGVRLKAADVNGSGGTPASVDALTVLRRFTGMILTFLPPNVPSPGQLDWVSESLTLNISGGNTYQQNIKIICTGDVNGSYIPF